MNKLQIAFYINLFFLLIILLSLGGIAINGGFLFALLSGAILAPIIGLVGFMVYASKDYDKCAF